MLKLDTDQIEPNIINCIGDIGKINEKKNKLDHLNATITNNCSKYEDYEEIGHGSYGRIYSMSGNPYNYLKISDMPYDSYSLLYSTNSIECEELESKLDKAINEVENTTKYAKLSYVFPLNIMYIDSAERCMKQYDQHSFVANKFIIEKIDGKTLYDSIVDMNETEIIYCLLQLIYVTLYANLHGYFHNDLSCSNIMLCYNNDVNNLWLDQLVINNKLILFNFNKKQIIKNIPIVKLIDFSYSTYINFDSDDLKDKIIVGEPQHIVKVLKNKLECISHTSASSILFTEIYKIIDNFTQSGNQQDVYIDLEINSCSTGGFRILTYNNIIQTAIDRTFINKIIDSIYLLKDTINSKKIGISVNIIDIEKVSIDDKQKLKYLKYNQKIRDLITKF